MQLFPELYPEMKVTGLVDRIPHASEAGGDRRAAELAGAPVLGKRLPPEEIQHKMELLGYTITFNGDNMHVVVPHMAFHRRRVHPGGHHGGGRPDVRLRELRGRAHHHVL